MDPTKRIELPQPRILVIDDSRLVRITINRTLRAEFDIKEAVDGEDGWQQISTDDSIQVVITDADMPRLNGFELVTRIRQSEDLRIREIPVIMITGVEAAQSSVREKALSIGATDFITKPFDKTQLLARIRAYAQYDQTKRILGQTSSALTEQSAIDPLTRVRNYPYLLHRGRQDLSFAQRHGHELSIIAIGIDKLHHIRDEYDQDTSDRLLQWVANIIKDVLRREDTIARIDDSRFVIIAPATGRLAAAVLCDRVRKRVAHTPFAADGSSLPVTVSLGLTNLGHDSADTIENFIAIVGQLVTQAQTGGGNRIAVGSQPLPTRTPPAPCPSIDVALKQLSAGNTEELQPHLTEIAGRILPLLDLCNRQLNWGLNQLLDELRDKVN